MVTVTLSEGVETIAKIRGMHNDMIIFTAKPLASGACATRARLLAASKQEP